MRPQVIQVGPLAASSATKISLSQKAAISGTNYLVLNGAAGSFSATSVAGSQTPAGAGALTLAAGAANLPLGSRIYITGGSDESAKTFVVAGTRYGGIGNTSYAVTETITGPNASTVSSLYQYDVISSITASGATTGAITVGHYTTATLDTARRVLFTSAGNDSSNTATVTGTDYAGLPISETLTLANATTAYTVLDYLIVTSITTSAAVATTITVGTNGVASSQWATFDPYANAAPVSIGTYVSGTANYSIQQTVDDPNSTSNAVARASVTWINHPDSGVVSATAAAQANYAYPPAYARVLLNSETGSGYAKATFTQQGS